MTRNEAETVFYEKDVLPLHEKYLSLMMQALMQEPERLKNQIDLCAKKAENRTEAMEFAPGYLMFLLLRTELLEGRGRYLIRVCDQDWYFGTFVDLFWFDAGWLYDYFFRFWEDARRSALKYMGRVTDFAVEKMALDLVIDYQDAALSFLDGQTDWNAVWPGVELYLGEYMGQLSRLGGEE